MDFNTITQTLTELLSGGNITLVGGAICCCLLTQIVKKFFLPKLNIDLEHRFDPTAFLPFLFALLFASVNVLLSGGGLTVAYKLKQIFVDTLSMGALSTVAYKIYANLDGNGLKQLLKDDLFSLFYNALFDFGEAKQQLLEGKITLKQFIGEIQTMTIQAQKIYAVEGKSDEIKEQELTALLTGIIDDDTLSKICDTLHLALVKYFG